MANNNISDNLRSQGFRSGKTSDLSYIATPGVREKEFIKQFQKSAARSTNPIVGILAMVTIGTIVICALNPNMETAMRIFMPVFVSLFSIPAIIVYLIRTYGAKKVGYAEVTTKYSRSSNGKSRQTLYFVNIIQPYPNKIYVENIQIYKSQFDRINPGDQVAIVKSSFGSTVFKVN